MRINSDFGVPQEQPADRVGGAGSAPASRTSQAVGGDTGDQASLSHDALQLSNLSNAIAGIPEVRQDRVAAVRQALQSGTYAVTNQQIAESMLRDFAAGNSSGQ